MKLNKSILLKDAEPENIKITKWLGFIAVLFILCTKIFSLHYPELNLILWIIFVVCTARTICKRTILRKYLIPGGIIAFIGMLLLPFNTILSDSGTKLYPFYRFAENFSNSKYIFGGLVIIWLFVLMFLCVVNLLDIIEINFEPVTINSKLTKTLFFAIPFLSMVFYWFDKWIFPYRKATDTNWQLTQIATGNFSDVHPAAHTLFLKLIMGIYNSPATVVLLQIISISLITGFVFCYFYKKGVSDKVLMPILVIWSCLDSVKRYTTYLFKDVFFSVALILLTFMLIKTLDKKEKTSIAEIILTGVALAAVFLFRHNGIITIICVIPPIIYLGFKYSKKILLSLIVFAIIIVPVKTVIFDAFNVQPNDNGTKYAMPAKAIVSVVKNDGNYTDEQLEKIEQLMPEKAIKLNYDRKIGQQMIWPDLMQSVDEKIYTFAETLEGKEKLIISLFFELLPQNFGIMCWDIIGSMSLMIQFQGDFLVHNMFYMFILLVLIFAIYKKYKKAYLFAFIPAFANIASVAISNISFEDRYAYPTILCFAILVSYAFYVFKNGEKRLKKIKNK